jgi:ankyrin repeat protein/predicted esterase
MCAGGIAAPAKQPELSQEQLQEAQQLLQQMASEFQAKKYAEGAETCRKLLAIVPKHPDTHYNLACGLSHLGKTEEALASLGKAVEFGYDDAGHLQTDDDLAPLRQDKRFTAIVEKARGNFTRAIEKGDDIPDTKTVEGVPEGGFPFRLRMGPSATREKPNRLIIWLHPAGGSMDKQVEALSPQFIRHGYALVVFTKKDFRNWDGGDIPKLGKTLDEVAKIEGISCDRPILMGHSAGGQMALLLWHGAPKGLGGLVLNAAYPIRAVSANQAQLIPPPQDAAIKTTPIYALVGTKDGGSQVWQQAEPAYNKVGVPTTVRYVEGKGHQWLLDKSEMPAFEKWLDQTATLAAAPAAGPGWRPVVPASPLEAKATLKFPEGKTSVAVPAEWGSHSLFVRVKINGQDAGYFLIHTGVPASMIDIETAKRLSLPVVGQAQIASDGAARQVPVHQINSLQIGDVTVGPHAILSNDLRQIKATLGEEFGGILAVSLWSQAPFTVDYNAPAIVFYERSSFKPPAGAVAEALQMQDGLPSVACKFGGKEPGRVLLDTGSTVFMTVAGPFAQAHGDLFTKAGGADAASGATLKSLELFGRTFPQTGVHVVPGEGRPGIAGTVGARCLKNFNLTFDYAEQKVYAKPRAAVSMRDRLAKGLKADHKDIFGLTPLHLAVSEGALADVQALLAAGADVNAADGLGRTPLLIAAAEGKPEIVRLLLGRSANPNAKAKDGRVPLMVAAERGSTETMQALLTARADLKAADNVGSTAVMYAAMAGKAEALKFLLAKGLDAKTPNKDSRTVLMAAAVAGDADCVKAIIAAGTDVNARDNQDQTALMYAAVFGRKAAVDALLAAKADVHTMNRQGQSALDLAKARHFPDIAAALEKAGAK